MSMDFYNVLQFRPLINKKLLHRFEITYRPVPFVPLLIVTYVVHTCLMAPVCRSLGECSMKLSSVKVVASIFVTMLHLLKRPPVPQTGVLHFQMTRVPDLLTFIWGS